MDNVEQLVRDYMLRNPGATQEEIQDLREAVEREQMAQPVVEAPAPITQPTVETPVTPTTQKPDLREYLMNKYEERFGPEAMKKAREQAESSWKTPGTIIGAGLAGIGQAIAGRPEGAFTAAEHVMSGARERATEKFVKPLQDEKAAFLEKIALGEKLSDADRKKLGWTREDEEFARGEAIRKEEADPTSVRSRVAQDLAKKLVPALNTEGMTASRLKDMLPQLGKIYEVEVRKEEAAARREETQAWKEVALKDRQTAREERKAERETEQLDKKVEKLSKDTEDERGMLNAVADVEGLMGFDLNDYDEKTGTLRTTGEEVDIPGLTIPVTGTRITAHSQAARAIDDSFQSVFNTLLKTRSGAAVTDQELQRLKKEFSEGAFRTEPEKLAALKRFKLAMARIMQSKESAAAPEAVQTFKERGGITSERYGAPQASGTKRKVYNPVTGRLE